MATPQHLVPPGPAAGGALPSAPFRPGSHSPRHLSPHPTDPTIQAPAAAPTVLASLTTVPSSCPLPGQHCPSTPITRSQAPTPDPRILSPQPTIPAPLIPHSRLLSPRPRPIHTQSPVFWVHTWPLFQFNSTITITASAGLAPGCLPAPTEPMQRLLRQGRGVRWLQKRETPPHQSHRPPQAHTHPAWAWRPGGCAPCCRCRPSPSRVGLSWVSSPARSSTCQSGAVSCPRPSWGRHCPGLPEPSTALARGEGQPQGVPRAAGHKAMGRHRQGGAAPGRRGHRKKD